MIKTLKLFMWRPTQKKNEFEVENGIMCYTSVVRIEINVIYSNVPKIAKTGFVVITENPRKCMKNDIITFEL